LGRNILHARKSKLQARGLYVADAIAVLNVKGVISKENPR